MASYGVGSAEEDLLTAPLDGHRGDGDGDGDGDGETRNNLIVNYLPQSMTDSEFSAMFVTLGPIEHSKIARDQMSGYSFGYGFIVYENAADAAKAIQNLNGLQGRNGGGLVS
jgi:RNA recognition motif-containing protein